MSFKCGDKVYIRDWGEGIITDVFSDLKEAAVQFETFRGGGCFSFSFDELRHVPKRIATLEVFKSVHGTVHVVIQNCDIHVNDFISLFDVWKSHGNYKYDGLESWEYAKIWFECSMEFLDFIKTPMGQEALRRLGIEKIEVRD